MTGIDLPTLSVVVTSAAVDSINPCAIGVLILMISLVLNNKGSIGKLLLLGGLYILAIYITYLSAGLGLIYFLANIPLWLTEYLSIAVGALVILAGLLEIKSYFWYGQGFQLEIPHYFAEKIHVLAKRVTVPGVMLLGAFVAGVELPCTGAPYLAIITLLSLNFNLTAFWLLLLYNVIFVAPLLIILAMVAMGVEVKRIKQWKEDKKHLMRLGVGILLIGLGWLLILIANGTINFI